LSKRVIVTRQIFAVDMPLLSQTHRDDSFVARLCGVGRALVTRAIAQKCPWLAAYLKNLKSETAVFRRTYRYAKYFQALAHRNSAESPSTRILHCGSESSLCGTEPRPDRLRVSADQGLPVSFGISLGGLSPLHGWAR
jgi:hypothetical protein